MVCHEAPSSSNIHHNEGSATMSTTEMGKAVCWELASTNHSILGLRVLLASTFVGTQMLSTDNERPRWSFTQFTTASAAAEAAVQQTEQFERDWSATLIVPPGEIALHPSEVSAMSQGKPISPSLRARIFTSLQRRDPRVGGESGATTP
jgi:hypothetical protein